MRITLYPLVVSCLFLSSQKAAFAQDYQQTVLGVMDRPRPEYDAKGIPLGGFRLFPSLDLSSGFDDNVFRLDSGASDWFFVESPTARLESQWGRHFLEFYAGANNYDYAKFSSLNLTDWDVGSDGRYDVLQGSSISAGGSTGEYHEPLYSPNTQGNQASPNRYHKSLANVTANYSPDRIGITIGGQYQRLSYENAALVGGGTIDNGDRNENEYDGNLRASYKFSPGYDAFLNFDYDTQNFDQYFDRSGIHRDTNGYRITGGLNLLLTHLISGEVAVGYLQQFFDQNQPIPLRNIAGLDFSAKLDWFATDLMTVHLNAGRYISDVVLDGASASDDKLVKLSADYEVLRNVIAQAYFSYDSSSLRGISRTDNYPGAGVGVRYLMNEYLSTNLMYNYNSRSSNFPSADYTDNTISLTVTGHI